MELLYRAHNCHTQKLPTINSKSPRGLSCHVNIRDLPIIPSHDSSINNNMNSTMLFYCLPALSREHLLSTSSNLPTMLRWVDKCTVKRWRHKQLHSWGCFMVCNSAPLKWLLYSTFSSVVCWYSRS